MLVGAGFLGARLLHDSIVRLSRGLSATLPSALTAAGAGVAEIGATRTLLAQWLRPLADGRALHAATRFLHAG